MRSPVLMISYLILPAADSKKRDYYEITGSDDNLFDPSRSRLEEAGLLPEKLGWNPDLVHHNLDFIILGMPAKSDNPELLRAQELGLKIYSFPSFIREQAKEQKRIVVAGSHGKTTTASMIVHILGKLGIRSEEHTSELQSRGHLVCRL